MAILWDVEDPVQEVSLRLNLIGDCYSQVDCADEPRSNNVVGQGRIGQTLDPANARSVPELKDEIIRIEDKGLRADFEAKAELAVARNSECLGRCAETGEARRSR